MGILGVQQGGFIVEHGVLYNSLNLVEFLCMKMVS